MCITSSHFIFSCLCIAMQLLVSFLYLYNACDILTPLSYTMRGWPFVVIELWVSVILSLPCHYFRLSVSCFYLTHVYHLTSTVLSSDHLACYPLVIPSCYTMTCPDQYQSLDLIGYLLNIITLSCYHFITSMIYLNCDITFTGTWLVILYHDQWPVFLLYMQWPGYIVLMYS